MVLHCRNHCGRYYRASGVVAPIYLRQFINLLSGSTPTEELARALFVALALFTATNRVSGVGQRLRLFSVNRLESSVMVDLYQNAFG